MCWLHLPYTRGAAWVHATYLQPWLDAHETKIDEQAAELKKKALGMRWGEIAEWAVAHLAEGVRTLPAAAKKYTEAGLAAGSVTRAGSPGAADTTAPTSAAEEPVKRKDD